MRRFLSYAVLLLFVLLFFWKLAFTDLILARGDSFLYFYPYWAARDTALSQGQLPLWTPDIFMGVPLLSDPQVGTLYPPNWLTVRLPAPEAMRISILLHVGWAALGAFLLARQVLALQTIPALIAAVVFAFGGYPGAHVEQINQLQGVSWLPFALLALHAAFRRPLVYTPLLGMVMALQVFSGHTQTVFITGLGLAVYALFATPHPLHQGRGVKTEQDRDEPTVRPYSRIFITLKRLGILFAAALITALLALPQLYPSLELTGLSNRGRGFNPQEAMAFSWNPFLAGRGLLPSYDAQVFGEYIAYVGIAGLMLALYGALAGDRRRWAWVALVVIGVFLAFGLYNPVYWTLAGLPGFNFFRVPARWLALFAIGGAMLAGLGAQILLTQPLRPRVLIAAALIVILIAFSTLFSDRAASEVDGQAVPGVLTWAAWSAALLLVVAFAVIRPRLPQKIMPALLLLIVSVELWFASWALPYNDLVDPAAYTDPRFTVRQLQTLQADAPGRVLSISNAFFDPGDLETLTERYTDLRLTERATRYAFTAAKLKELVASNLPMVWNVPSIDGYGGGVTPTAYYTQFTSLLLPDGMMRTVDGRLRELLAQQTCRGACLPEVRFLNLMNVRYLIVDKTYDLSHEGIRYDTAFTRPEGSIAIASDFVSTAIHLLYTGDSLSEVAVGGESLPVNDGGDVGGFKLAVASLPAPQTVSEVMVGDVERLVALTLVDTRTGDFVQIPLGEGWRLVLSSDIKLYENTNAFPRAFVVTEAQFVPDTWLGTETAVVRMREAAFDPRSSVILSGEGEASTGQIPNTTPPAHITLDTPTRIEITSQSNTPAYLVLSDAYFPGWKGTVNGEAVSLYRANVMFRAVPIPAGESIVVMEYAPEWLSWLFPVGVVGWGAALLWLGFGLNRKQKVTLRRIKEEQDQLLVEQTV